MVDMPCTKLSFALVEALRRQCFGRTDHASFRPSVSIKGPGAAPGRFFWNCGRDATIMTDHLSSPIFHQYLRYVYCGLLERPHAHVSLDRGSIRPGSCIIPFSLALRIGDRGDGAARRSNRRDPASGVVGRV